jgi:hypothetical protein
MGTHSGEKTKKDPYPNPSPNLIGKKNWAFLIYMWSLLIGSSMKIILVNSSCLKIPLST